MLSLFPSPDADRAEPTHPVATRFAWLVGCALVLFARAPQLLLEPRVTAEEAGVYLSYAFSNGFLRTLLLIPTTEGPAGYLHLVANLSSLVAIRGLPLELAPAVGTTFAFAMHLMPLAIVIWGRSRLWNTPRRRALACLVLLFAAPVRHEIWLQVIHAQVFLGIVAVLLLFEELEAAGKVRIWSYRSILALGALTGAYTAILAPVYGLRAYWNRDPESRKQFLIVASGAVVQAAAFFGFVWSTGEAEHRLGALGNADVPTALLVDHLLQPVIGSHLAPYFHAVPASVGLLSAAGTLVVLALLFRLAARAEPRDVLLLPISLALSMASTSVLAFGAPISRYAVVSGIVLLLTFLVASWSRTLPASVRLVCLTLTAVGIVCGFLDFWAPPSSTPRFPGVTLIEYRPERPVWKEELARWRRDPQYALRVWPYSASRSWTMNLSPSADFEALRERLQRGDEYHLSMRPFGERSLRIPIPPLPPDFRILFRGTSQSRGEAPDLRLRLENRANRAVVEVRVPVDHPEGAFQFNRWRSSLEQMADSPLAEVEQLVIQARAGRGAALVTVGGVEIVPRVRGLLDGVLPTRDLPDSLFLRRSRSPLAQEAEPLLALLSWVEDGDLVVDDGDRARGNERWSDGGHPEESEFPTPTLFLALMAPVFHLAGAEGVVLANLTLLTTMLVLALAWRWDEGPRGRAFAAGSLGLGLTTAYAFLPQPTVLEAAFLFLPLLAWLRGWNRTTPVALFALGACLGTTLHFDLLWLPLVLIPLGFTWNQASHRRSLALTVGIATTVLLLWLIPGLGLGTSDPAAGARDGGVWSQVVDVYFGRAGLFLGYPFAATGFLLAILRNEDRRILTFAGVSAGILLWIACTHTAGAPLGSPRLAVLAPCLTLLPSRVRSWWPTVVATTVGVLLTWGALSGVWTP